MMKFTMDVNSNAVNVRTRTLTHTHLEQVVTCFLKFCIVCLFVEEMMCFVAVLRCNLTGDCKTFYCSLVRSKSDRQEGSTKKICLKDGRKSLRKYVSVLHVVFMPKAERQRKRSMQDLKVWLCQLYFLCFSLTAYILLVLCIKKSPTINDAAHRPPIINRVTP